MGKKMDEPEIKKECPSCGLGVALEATICEFCGWDFEEEDEWILQIEKLERDLMLEKQKFAPGTVSDRIESTLHNPAAVKAEMIKSSPKPAQKPTPPETVSPVAPAPKTPQQARVQTPAPKPVVREAPRPVTTTQPQPALPAKTEFSARPAPAKAPQPSPELERPPATPTQPETSTKVRMVRTVKVAPGSSGDSLSDSPRRLVRVIKAKKAK